MQRKFIFYKTADNACPAEVFLSSLPPKAIVKMTWVLRLALRLERVPAQFFCKMEGADDIWEFRVRSGSTAYRIFAFWDKHHIVLTHGIVKKTQKTPPKEIEKAKAYKQDYWQRKG